MNHTWLHSIRIFSRTVVLLSGRFIGVHEYRIRKRAKMCKRDINLKPRQLQDVLLRVFGTKFAPFNSIHKIKINNGEQRNNSWKCLM